MRFIIILLFSSIFCANCDTTTVNWQFQKGFTLQADEQIALLQLARTLGFNNVYEVEVGFFGKYDSSKAAVVKQVALLNDTLRQEKWLYLWKREWTISQLFRGGGDSSIRNSLFVTGQKCIRNVDKFIYRNKGQEKIFKFTSNGGSYNDVKQILDCVLDGSAIEDSMTFREETKDTWKAIKENALEFKAVMMWAKDYTFDYDIPNSKPTELQLRARKVGKVCLIYYAGPRGAGN